MMSRGCRLRLAPPSKCTRLPSPVQGHRSDAIHATYSREMDTYKGTSIIMRLNKNVNLLGLEGTAGVPVERPKDGDRSRRRWPRSRASPW